MLDLNPSPGSWTPIAPYVTEEAYRLEFVDALGPRYFLCPKCGNDGYSIDVTHNLRICSRKRCKYPESLTSGSVLRGTKTSLSEWFEIFRSIANHPPGMPVAQIFREAHARSYKGALDHVRRVRQAMADSPQKKLQGLVELGEALLQEERRETRVILAVAGSSASPNLPPSLQLMLVPGTNEESHFSSFVRDRIAAGSTIQMAVHELSVSKELAKDYEIMNRHSCRTGSLVCRGQEPSSPLAHELDRLQSWFSQVRQEVQSEHLPEYLGEYSFRAGNRLSPRQTLHKILKILF